MSTALQEDLAEAIVKNKKLPRDKRKNKRDLLVSAGYSPITAKANPQVIIDQKGVQKALENFGLTRDLITKALVDDINAKPSKRVKELALGADILGMTEHDEKIPSQITNNLTQIIINAPYAAEARDQSNGETVPSVASTPEQ